MTHIKLTLTNPKTGAVVVEKMQIDEGNIKIQPDSRIVKSVEIVSNYKQESNRK